MPEADALARPLDQPGHVRDGQLRAVWRLDRAEHRLERRERVVGDLRRRVRDAPEEGRLAGVGRPASAASATSLRRSSSVRSAPGSPVSAKRGAWRVGVAKRGVAASAARRRARRRPRRPAARGRRRARRPRSDLRADRHGELDGVAVGAVPAAATAVAARRRGDTRRPRSDERSRSEASATSATSPPRPPSPPSGPPFGTYFSRRKPSAPSPPRPERTMIATRSWNTAAAPSWRGGRYAGSAGAVDRHRAALAAPVELDDALAQREERVVAADPDAGAGAEARAALPDDDHAGLDLLAGEDLHAEPLRLGVAAVLRGAEALLVCHLAASSPSAIAASSAAIAPLRLPCACSYSSAARRPAASQPPAASLHLRRR